MCQQIMLNQALQFKPPSPFQYMVHHCMYGVGPPFKGMHVTMMCTTTLFPTQLASPQEVYVYKFISYPLVATIPSHFPLNLSDFTHKLQFFLFFYLNTSLPFLEVFNQVNISIHAYISFLTHSPIGCVFLMPSLFLYNLNLFIISPTQCFL